MINGGQNARGGMDNLVVYAVPEPVSLALMGVGGVLLLTVMPRRNSAPGSLPLGTTKVSRCSNPELRHESVQAISPMSPGR